MEMAEDITVFPDWRMSDSPMVHWSDDNYNVLLTLYGVHRVSDMDWDRDRVGVEVEGIIIVGPVNCRTNDLPPNVRT